MKASVPVMDDEAPIQRFLKPALVDIRRDRTTGAELAQGRGVAVEPNTVRNALYDADKTAGGVFGRRHAELRAIGGRDARDATDAGLRRRDVADYRHLLALPHVRNQFGLKLASTERAPARAFRLLLGMAF